MSALTQTLLMSIDYDSLFKRANSLYYVNDALNETNS
jgi:hypothetical protein